MVSILAGIDAGRLHVGQQLAGGRLHLPAGAAVAQDRLAAVLDHVTVNGIDTKSAGSPALVIAALTSSTEALVMKAGIVRLLPDAVVDRGDFGGADLVGRETAWRVGRLLRKGGRHRSLALRPSAAARPAETTKSRRDRLSMVLLPLGIRMRGAGAPCADGSRTSAGRAVYSRACATPKPAHDALRRGAARTYGSSW